MKITLQHPSWQFHDGQLRWAVYGSCAAVAGLLLLVSVNRRNSR